MPATDSANNFDVRIDHHFNENNSLFGRYSYNRNENFTPGSFPLLSSFTVNEGTSLATTTVNNLYPANAGSNPSLAQNAQVNFIHLFNSQLLLELKGGYTRIDLSSYIGNEGNLGNMFGIPNANFDEYTTGLPAISFTTGYAGLGDRTFVPNLIFDSTTQFMGAVSWTKGSHSLKFGASVLHGGGEQIQNRWGTGSYTFGSMVSFLQGVASTRAQRAYLTGVQNLSTWEYGFYVQDNWRVTPKLTLNLGLRYSIFTPFTEKDNGISSFDPIQARVNYAGQDGVSATAGISTDYSNIDPRIGAAYSLRPGSVIRGGFAISHYSQTPGAGIYLKNDPNELVYSGTGSITLAAGLPLLKPAASQSAINGAVTGIEPDFKNGKVYQFTINLQQDIHHFVFGLGYVGVLTRDQAMNVNVNSTVPGDPATVNARMSTSPYYAQFPLVTGNMQLLMSRGFSNYHAMQASVERRYGTGLTLNFNYTWAHGLSDVMPMSGRSQSSGWGIVLNNKPWSSIPDQIADNDYGNSDLDIRHRVALNGSYKLPFAKNAKGIVGVLAKDWTVNGIYAFMTGQAYSVITGVNGGQAGTNCYPANASDRASLVGDWQLPNPTITKWFNTAAFQKQAVGTLGKQGRNSLRGPIFRHLDFSLGKQFAITETKSLQFRMETFNITNTPNFALPNNNFSNAAFGTITSSRFSPRQIQFALKLMF